MPAQLGFRKKRYAYKRKWYISVLGQVPLVSLNFVIINTIFFQSGTLLVVPGICNHAENTYVKAFSQHMMSLGFQVVVFNHTGALKSVKLNRGKIFTYGE